MRYSQALFRKRIELKGTNTAKGSEAATVLLPSESYISRTPRLSQIYTITPLSNLHKDQYPIIRNQAAKC